MAYYTSNFASVHARAKAAQRSTQYAERNQTPNSASSLADLRLKDFEAANPQFAAWWTDTELNFAKSLRAFVCKNGYLTKPQRDAALRIIDAMPSQAAYE